MSKDVWGNEEDAFEDRPDEIQEFAPPPPVAQRQAPPQQNNFGPPRPSNIPAEPAYVNPVKPDRRPQQQRIAQQYSDQQYEEEQAEEVDYSILDQIEEEDDFSEVLNDAHLRLEQGSLYKIIMNHDLFAGMDADPKAIKNVEREVRTFARERMEVMLGMRQEKAKIDAAIISSPFNDLEVDILKKLASKATNGATETPEANQVAAQVKMNPRRQTLNPIGGTTSLKKTPPPIQAANKQRLPTKPQVPIARKKLDATIDQICAEEGVDRSLLEEHYRPLEKAFDQLTDKEQQERARQTKLRIEQRKTVKATNAIPMATPEQEELMAMQRATQVGQAPGMAAILAKVNSMPMKNNGQ